MGKPLYSARALTIVFGLAMAASSSIADSSPSTSRVLDSPQKSRRPLDTAPPAPQHVSPAETLVVSLKGSPLNVYGKGRRTIDWTGSPATARTVCSSFATLLLEHAYGWKDRDIKSWFGKADPDAADYHDIIVAENGFSRVRKIGDLLPGDFIAIKYNDGSSDTGHVMMIDGPLEKLTDTEPIEPNTTQYGVPVIDSSASGHGKSDTRWIHGDKFTGGIGHGVFRLYASPSGNLVGYAWSTSIHSTYYKRPARALVVGRLSRS